MKQEDIMCELFNFSIPTYYKRKREKNKAIAVIERYFQKEEILEFLNTGKVRKFENITYDFLLKNKLFYVNSFAKSQTLLSEPDVNDKFKDFYFSFLNFGEIDFPFNIDVLGIQSLLTHYLYQYQTQEMKKNLKIVKINEKLKDLKLTIDEAISSSNGKKRKELEKYKQNFQEEIQKEEILEDIFSVNEKNFERIMLHFHTFEEWNNDIYYFLKLVKNEEFDYFINSKNDELLYQAIGYLVYSFSHNLNMEEKLQLIYSSFHYFIFNKDLISSTNIKEHILKRLKSPASFSDIDKEIAHKYITSPFPTNNKTNMNSIEDNENEVVEEISIKDFIKKY